MPPQPPQARAADGGIRTGHRGNGPSSTEAPDPRFRIVWSGHPTSRQGPCQRRIPPGKSVRKAKDSRSFRKIETARSSFRPDSGICKNPTSL
jgi:hypothetical protein